MEHKNDRSSKNNQVSKLMRTLHRYIGFFLLTIMAIYALTGVVLIYRDTAIFKQEVHIEKTLATNLDEQQLEKAIKIKKLKITKQQDNILYFKQGQYDRQSGLVQYTEMQYPKWLDELIRLHKGNSEYAHSWLTTLFAIALFFFTFSSLWMIPGSKRARRISVSLVSVGILLAILLILTD